MATNRVFADGTQFSVEPTEHIGAETAVESGDAILFGELPGVALTDEDDDEVTAQFDGVFELEVHGDDGSDTESATAITAGDIVYFDASGDNELNVASGETRFGYALEGVDSGEKTVIKVKIGY